MTGLCEESASFTFSRNGPRNVCIVFALKLPAADAPLTTALQSYFSAGRIYAVRPAPSSSPLTQSGETSYFRVTRAAELMRVVSHFDRYPLQGHKQRQFRIWREAVIAKQNLYRVDHESLNGLLNELSDSRREAVQRRKGGG